MGDQPFPKWNPAITLRTPPKVDGRMKGFATENLETRPLMVLAQNSFEGQTLALCGAGPSLKGQDITGVDRIFACNSALPYLVDQGVPVTAGVAIDQTLELLEEWKDAPDVPYFVATTCHPKVIRRLREHGRQVIFFHNFVGFSNEFEWYCRHWPPTLMVGQGYTVVDRFLGAADWLGFTHVDVYGADHAFRGNPERGTPAGDEDVTHADGTLAASAYVNPLILEGEIDGRVWRTRPDMLIAAVHLARRVRDSGGKIRLMGDTLPGALLDKDDAFLDEVCKVLTPEEAKQHVLV